MKQYEVTFKIKEVKGTYRITVSAQDEKTAERAAFDDLGCVVKVVRVKEVTA